MLQAGAEVGAHAGQRQATSPADAVAASSKAAAREASRRRVSQRTACGTVFEVLELDQLEDYPLFVRADLRRVGIAVTTRAKGGATLLSLVVLTEGAGCGSLR